jgi:transcriptional regulator with XRE-family HTH domain
MSREVAGPPPEAELLRLARKAMGLSQQAVADGAGVSRAMVQAVEYGTRTGADEMIAALAAFLRITPDRLAADGGRPVAAAVLAEMHARDADALAVRIAALDPVVQATIMEFLDKAETVANRSRRNGRPRSA